jgi:sugar phosphate isomerase/epimerase
MYTCLNRATAGAGLSMSEFVQLSARAGFDGCDIDMGWAVSTGAESARSLFHDHKQRIGGWGPFDWRGDDASFRDGVKSFEASAKVAAQLGADSCATWIMPSSERRFIDNWSFHVKRLKELERILDAHRLRLGLEFVAPYHLRTKFPHEFIFTPGQMLELAADVGENVGLLVDSFHCNNAGITWDDLAKIPASKMVLVHINDCPPGPLSDVQDFRRVLPGEGVIDLRGFIGALRTTGYRGPVSVEVFCDDLKALAPDVAALRASEATKRVFDD